MTNETEERADLECDVIDSFESRDELGQALFHLALAALTRGDMRMMHDFFEVDRMDRCGGQPVDLNSCEAFGAVSQRVKGEELGQWARAVSAIMDIGSPDIMHALDALARRRACH